MKLFIIMFYNFIFFNNILCKKLCGYYSSYVENKYKCNKTIVPIEGYHCCFVKGNLQHSINEYVQFCYPVDSSKLYKLNIFKEKLLKGYLYGKSPLQNLQIECNQKFLISNYKIIIICLLYIFFI